MVRDEFQIWMQQRVHAVEQALDATVSAYAPMRLGEAMRYVALGGGKRVRALLVLGACDAVGGDRALAMDAAVAIELIHAYSLVHDDLPCMDDDDMRRGKPTVHVLHGEAMGVLVGDALQTLAFETLACGDPAQARARLALCRQLALAAGAFGMVGGQVIDIGHVGDSMDEAMLSDMHRRKTGALLKAALLMGAACAEDSESSGTARLLGTFGETIGLAFQVTDDVLDATASTEQLGKTAGKDSSHNKPTYVSLLGVENATALASRLREEAHALLGALPDDRAASLHMLTDLIVDRLS